MCSTVRGYAKRISADDASRFIATITVLTDQVPTRQRSPPRPAMPTMTISSRWPENTALLGCHA